MSVDQVRSSWREKLDPWITQPAWAHERPRVFLLAALALFALAYGYLCALQMGQLNQNRAKSDQQNNIELARASKGDWLPSRTDGVVNPLWPWLAGKLVVTEDANEDSASFTRGKWLNVGITLAFTLGLGMWASRRLPLLPTLTLTALCGFGSMAQRAPFFQPEPLFYILFFLTTCVGASLLVRNPLPAYAALGLLAGLCYLAKASVTPFLGIVLAFTSGIAVLCMFPRIHIFWREVPELFAQAGFSWKRHWVGMAITIAAFALVLLPRGVYSQKQFGDPLHSFPKYWMWQDDFGKESTQFMLNYPKLREEAKAGGKPLPSAGVYIREKGLDHLGNRLVSGTSNALATFFQPEDRTPWAKKSKKMKPWKHVLRYRGYYLAALAAWLVALAAATWAGPMRKQVNPTLTLHAPFLAALALSTFVVYALAYGLYETIGKGDRFMLSLYMPIVAALVFAEGSLLRVQKSSWPPLASTAVHAAILIAVILRILQITKFPNFQD